MTRLAMVHTAAADWRDAFTYDHAAYDRGTADAIVRRASRSPYAPDDYRTVAYICGFNDLTAKRQARSRLEPAIPIMIAAE